MTAQEWNERFKKLPQTSITIEGSGNNPIIEYHLGKFGDKKFVAEESIVEKLYKIEHENNRIQRHFNIGCKIFSEYRNDMWEELNDAYSTYSTNGDIKPFADILTDYTPKSNENRGYLIPIHYEEVFSLYDSCMINEDDNMSQFLTELFRIVHYKSEPYAGGIGGKIGKWIFYEYIMDMPKNINIICDTVFCNTTPFESYICYKYHDWLRWESSDIPTEKCREKVRFLIKNYSEIDLYFDINRMV